MRRRKQEVEKLNQILVISKEAVTGKCEDSYAYNLEKDYGMLAVFDGCGGLGAKQYKKCENHTAAYISSRIVANTVQGWFETNFPCTQEGFLGGRKFITEGLKAELDRVLGLVKRQLDTDGMELSGSLTRSFPTTASVAVVDGQRKDEMSCLFLWAGDSRGYILQPGGLKQCTKDDLRIEADAFENLYADSPLSNMVNGEGRYHINAQRFRCKSPAIVFTATDGMFGYYPSPMHFELMLLKTLQQSKSFHAWQEKIKEAISEVTGDDSTMVMAVYGWKSFPDMQRAFQKRYRALTALLSEAVSQDELKEIWGAYKDTYNVYVESAEPEMMNQEGWK